MKGMRLLLAIAACAVLIVSLVAPAHAAGVLTEGVKITKVKDHSGAGTSDITSDAVDMAGYEGVMFVTSLGTAAANNTMHAEQSSDSGGSPDTFADLAGTEVALGGTSDEDLWLDIYRPRERYVRVIVTPGTSSTVESIWAIQYKAKFPPVDNTTTGTIAGERHVAPAEGTK